MLSSPFISTTQLDRDSRTVARLDRGWRSMGSRSRYRPFGIFVSPALLVAVTGTPIRPLVHIIDRIAAFERGAGGSILPSANLVRR